MFPVCLQNRVASVCEVIINNNGQFISHLSERRRWTKTHQNAQHSFDGSFHKTWQFHNQFMMRENELSSQLTQPAGWEAKKWKYRVASGPNAISVSRVYHVYTQEGNTFYSRSFSLHFAASLSLLYVLYRRWVFSHCEKLVSVAQNLWPTHSLHIKQKIPFSSQFILSTTL